MRKLRAIFIRDFQNEVSYKTSFVLQFAGIIVTVLLWYFMAQFMGKAVDVKIDGKSVDYFGFVLVGIAAMRFLNTASSSFSTRLRNEQLTGTLEAMIITPTSIPTIIFSWAGWDFFMAIISMAITFAMGIALFGMKIKLCGVPSFLVILLLTVLIFSAIGILSASFIMVLKKGDPVTFLVANISALLGGVFFPLEVLPRWLAIAARILPITWSLDAMRKSLLQGTGFIGTGKEIIILSGFVLLLLPASLALFSWALKRAKRDGTLVQY